MLTKYIQTALRQAKHEILDDDGSFYGEIPALFQGLRQRRNLGTMPGAKCREQIEEVLEEWILIRVFKNLPLPMVDGQGGCLVPRFGPIVE